MTDIASIHFDNNVWNACVPLTDTDLTSLSFSQAGAIVMKTVTLEPTQGNPEEYKLYDNYSMNNIALHNDGIDSMLTQLIELKTRKPIFLSLYGTQSEILNMLEKIELVRETLNVPVLVEWNLSCPNVEKVSITSETLSESILTFKRHCTGPFGIKLGLDDEIELIQEAFDYCDFITAINSVYGISGRRIHKKAVEYVRKLAAVTKTPIIGCGGAENREDVDRFLDAGAIAVEMGTAFLRYGISVFKSDEKRRNLRGLLRKHKIIQEGEFKLSGGAQSSFYFDFRKSFSIPALWETLILHTLDRIKDIDFDYVCGVPSGAVPLAAIIAFRCRKPLLMCRSSTKTHGTKKLVEGEYECGGRVLLFEDVITTGTSALITAKTLSKHGLVVKDVFSFLNRSTNYNTHGISFRSLLRVNEFIGHKHLRRYGRRLTQSAPTIHLKHLMKVKKTKICLSVDIPEFEVVLDLVEKVAPHICMLKLHFDILDIPANRLSYFMAKLCILMEDYNFMLFADRKLVDIPAITSEQVFRLHQKYNPSFVTSFLLEGTKSLLPFERQKQNVFLVTSMSSSSFGHTDPLYIRRVLDVANNPIVSGIITQEKLDTDVLHLVPGIKLISGTDGKGQKYRTPEDVKDFADIIIVGRGITESEDPVSAVIQYKERMN
jgi:uridine monophosphate synthetase